MALSKNTREVFVNEEAYEGSLNLDIINLDNLIISKQRLKHRTS